MSDESTTRVPWSAYYITPGVKEPLLDYFSLPGLVCCPICSQHFNNVQFLRHCLSHLLINELHLGTLMAFEFCVECLGVPNDVTMTDHCEIHRHVEQLDPLAVMCGKCVCPVCESTFPSVIKFAAHLYERHTRLDSPYVCTICYAFRSSYFCELLSHFHKVHIDTNQMFCPYCLKHFELPVTESANIFTAVEYYEHIRLHWNRTTYRCESCRLDFVHRKDHKLHDYSHHNGIPLSCFIAPLDESNDQCSQPADNLCLYFSNQLTTQTPRLSLRCLECGDNLRQPINKHFNLTLNCASCKYATSCNIAVNWHWSCVHSAPPIPNPIDVSAEAVLCTQPHTKTDVKTLTMHSHQNYDACGAFPTRIRKCKEKHAPVGLFYRGVLRCACGFRTIVCDQMARHLATEDHDFGTMDFSPRIAVFTIIRRRSKFRRTSSWWSRKSKKTPYILKSVGLCRS